MELCKFSKIQYSLKEMSKEKKTCRICLRFDSKLRKTSRSLFEIHNGSSILDNIILIANIKIQADDGLPSRICAECLSELDAAISFKDKCERSNKLLHSVSKFEHITSPVIELPISIELVKKEDTSEDDIQYEEVKYYVDDCDLETETETEETHTKLTSLVKPELNLKDVLATSEPHQPVLKKSKAIDLKLECHDCGGSFKSKCKLRVHWKKVHMLEKLICNFCKRTFKTYSTYHNHLKKRPLNCVLVSKTRIEGIGKSREFHCKHCSFKSRRAHDFENHFNIHTDDRPHYCKLCSKGFKQLSSLDTHNENVHKIIKKEITCQYCGELVKGRCRIQRHLQRHTNTPVQCDICKKMYKTKTTLIEHLKHHSGVKPFTCEKCAASFYTHTTLLNHKRLVHRTDKFIHKCDTCGYKLASSASLKRHLLKHKTFNIVCKLCGRFYLNAEELASHQKNHTKEKSVCLQCNKIFCNEKSLKRHKATTHKHKQNLFREKSVNPKNETNSVAQLKDEKIEVEIFPLLP